MMKLSLFLTEILSIPRCCFKRLENQIIELAIVYYIYISLIASYMYHPDPLGMRLIYVCTVTYHDHDKMSICSTEEGLLYYCSSLSTENCLVGL